jgi:hypothetical protein
MANDGGIEITKDTLTKGIDDLMPNIQDIVFKLFQYWKTVAVNEMRHNAKWTDRTGNARNGLNGAVFEDDKSIEMHLYHSMPYGVFLEVRWSGRYAVIGPTMMDIAPRLAQQISAGILRGGSSS